MRVMFAAINSVPHVRNEGRPRAAPLTIVLVRCPFRTAAVKRNQSRVIYLSNTEFCRCGFCWGNGSTSDYHKLNGGKVGFRTKPAQ